MRIGDEYDIVVIGAGPAGSTAAKFAADKASVLVVDKHREIGSPKRCGEGVGIRTFNEFGIPIDKRFINTEIYGSVVYAPNGKELKVRQENIMGYVIERKIFDKYLATDAVRNGATVVAESHASLWKEDGKLVGVKVKHQGEKLYVRSKMVIAADGVESQIARDMGIDTTLVPYEADSCIEYEMCGIDFDEMDLLHVFVGQELAPRGYVWVFPKDDDRANVGIGIVGNEKKTAKYYLDRFIAKRPGLMQGSILEVNVGSVPVGGFMEDFVKDNFMVVGDAARQINPMHGGGIYEVMLGGKLAGDIAGKAIEENNMDLIKNYAKMWESVRGQRLKKVLKVRNFIEKLNDKEIDYLADIWSGEDLFELTRGNYVSVFKKIIKHPKLLKMAKNLI